MRSNFQIMTFPFKQVRSKCKHHSYNFSWRQRMGKQEQKTKGYKVWVTRKELWRKEHLHKHSMPYKKLNRMRNRIKAWLKELITSCLRTKNSISSGSSSRVKVATSKVSCWMILSTNFSITRWTLDVSPKLNKTYLRASRTCQHQKTWSFEEPTAKTSLTWCKRWYRRTLPKSKFLSPTKNTATIQTSLRSQI